MYAAALVTNHPNSTDLEGARYGKEVATLDLCCLFRTGWSVSTWKCPARGVLLNKLTSGRIMTISTGLGDVGQTPPWKKTPHVWKRDAFKWEAECRNGNSPPWRTQEMISGVNEAFQECSATSWYGEVNKTCHLKGNLAWRAQLRPSSRKNNTHRGRPTASAAVAEMSSVMKARRAFFLWMEGHVHVRRWWRRFLMGWIVGKIQDTSLHRQLTLYKCFSQWVCAYAAAETASLWIMQEGLRANQRPLVSTRRLQVHWQGTHHRRELTFLLLSRALMWLSGAKLSITGQIQQVLGLGQDILFPPAFNFHAKLTNKHIILLLLCYCIERGSLNFKKSMTDSSTHLSPSSFKWKELCSCISLMFCISLQ